MQSFLPVSHPPKIQSGPATTRTDLNEDFLGELGGELRRMGRRGQTQDSSTQQVHLYYDEDSQEDVNAASDIELPQVSEDRLEGEMDAIMEEGSAGQEPRRTRTLYSPTPSSEEEGRQTARSEDDELAHIDSEIEETHPVTGSIVDNAEPPRYHPNPSGVRQESLQLQTMRMAAMENFRELMRRASEEEGNIHAVLPANANQVVPTDHESSQEGSTASDSDEFTSQPTDTPASSSGSRSRPTRTREQVARVAAIREMERDALSEMEVEGEICAPSSAPSSIPDNLNPVIPSTQQSSGRAY